MKKIILSAAIAALLCSSMTSCMGSFALTRNLYSWNSQMSNKFVNELVFIAFWIVPVYEVCSLADLLVINSIEFWSGDNPMTASTKSIDTEQGRYLVKCDGKGYDVTLESTGESFRLDFAADTQTWSVQYGDTAYPLMTFIDDTHVKMPDAKGNFIDVELSYQGVLAYQILTSSTLLASK